MLKLQSNKQFIDVGVAKNLSDLQRIARVLQFGASNAYLWFRGHVRASWPLQSSLHRSYDAKAEAEMLGAFRQMMSEGSNSAPSSPADLMWHIQRKNGPTRLLEWSKSVAIAAFFAVGDESNDEEDGVIWVTSQGILNWFLTGSSLSHQLCEADIGSGHPVLAVTPSKMDRTLAIQQGVYTIHNDKTPLEEIPKARQGLHRILIPASMKAHFRVELNFTCGINEAYLFPDDASRITGFIKRNTVPDMLSSAKPGFDVHAVNIAPVPELPLDHPVVWGKRKESTSDEIIWVHDGESACTCRTAECQVLVESVSAATKYANRLTITPELGDVVRVLDGEFEGFVGQVDEIDAASSVARVSFHFFGQLRKARFRLGQMERVNDAGINGKPQ